MPPNRRRQLAITIIFAALMGGSLWLFLNQPPLEASPTKPRAFGTPVGEHSSPDGDWLKLEMFALSVPLADDLIDPNQAETEQLLFRNPTSLEPFDPAELDAIGVPLSWREVMTAGRWRPQLRLVFSRTESDPGAIVEVRTSEMRVLDARTNVNVGHGATSWSGPRDLVIFDLGIQIWHDTPVELALLINASEFDPYEAHTALYRIEGMPDMPNGREIEDLFDVRIPRLTMRQMPQDNNDIEYRMARVAAMAVELRSEGIRHADGVGGRVKTLKDVTPRDLIDHHVKAHRRVVISHDPEADTLYFSYPEPWTKRVRQWWNGWSPEWMQW